LHEQIPVAALQVPLEEQLTALLAHPKYPPDGAAADKTIDKTQEIKIILFIFFKKN
jgi:hypothetical protein